MIAPASGTVERWAWDYIHATSIGAKLAPPPVPERWEERASLEPRRLTRPGRPSSLSIATKASKTRGLATATGRARALHAFLHHELQAAELMAWALLAFPAAPREFREGLVRIALDEVRHMQLYAAQIERLGHQVGDFAVRDWFWERIPTCADPASFVAVMGLGLESANLEHAASFAARFREAGDEEAARVEERRGRRRDRARALRGALVHRARRRARLREVAPRPPAAAFPAAHARSAVSAERPRARRIPTRLPRPTRSMAARRAWVLNLDADLELGASGPYAPTKSVRLAMKPHVASLAASLLGPEDVLVDEGSPAGSAGGLSGRAFCPTARALAILRRAGADPEPSPPLDVVRRVNSRAFASALGPTLPGSAFVTDLERARAALEGEPPVGDGWRIKYAFGMAGRNQRVVSRATLGEDDLAFVARGLARGGVQIEPNVAIDDEYALHGLVAVDGRLRLGTLVRQRCDARGAWLSTARVDAACEPLGDVPARMSDEARCVGRALFEAGYFGPFGIDGFTYRDRRGDAQLQVRSEINARYSMGFAIGFPEGT